MVVRFKIYFVEENGKDLLSGLSEEATTLEELFRKLEARILSVTL